MKYLCLVYIDEQGNAVYDHTEVKRLLDLVRTACKGRNQPLPAVYQPFNRDTDDGRNMQAYSDLLDRAIAGIIDVQEQKELDSLFSGGRTTALTHAIQGLDDFELLSFIVIRPEPADR